MPVTVCECICGLFLALQNYTFSYATNFRKFCEQPKVMKSSPHLRLCTSVDQRQAPIEPRHEKRDTNDIRIVLRGGQSKLHMPICNVWCV